MLLPRLDVPKAKFWVGRVCSCGPLPASWMAGSHALEFSLRVLRVPSRRNHSCGEVGCSIVNAIGSTHSRIPNLKTPQVTAQSDPIGFNLQHPGGGARLLGAKMHDAKGQRRERRKQCTCPRKRQRPFPLVPSATVTGSLIRTPSRIRCGSGNLSRFNSYNSFHRAASPSCSRAMLA